MEVASYCKCPAIATDLLREYDLLAKQEGFSPRHAIDPGKLGRYAFDPGIIATIFLGVVSGVLTDLLMSEMKRRKGPSINDPPEFPAAGLLVKAREAREAIEMLKEQGLSDQDAATAMRLLEEALIRVLRSAQSDDANRQGKGSASAGETAR